jgi:hypothetical protein
MDHTLYPEIRWATMVLAGLVCLWLAVRMLGSYRTAADHYERSARELRSRIAEARHLISEARQDLEKLESATTTAAEQLRNLPSTGQTPINLAREAAVKSAKAMLAKLDNISQMIEADRATNSQKADQGTTSPIARWVDPAHHGDSVMARYLAAALPFTLAAALIARALLIPFPHEDRPQSNATSALEHK